MTTNTKTERELANELALVRREMEMSEPSERKALRAEEARIKAELARVRF
jgi:hypothetical protein